MRAPFASFAIASLLTLTVEVARADTVPRGILLGDPPPASGCASPELRNHTDQLACTLLRSHPTELCLAVTEPGLGCPTFENLRPCAEFAQPGTATARPQGHEPTQCTFRRPSIHFADLQQR